MVTRHYHFDKLKSYMLATTPKVHAFEHEDLLQKLLKPHNKDTAMHFVNAIIYFASNKLPFPNAKSRNSSSSTLDIEDDMIR